MLKGLFEEDDLRRYKIYVDYDNAYGFVKQAIGRNIQDIGFFKRIQQEFNGYARSAGIEAFANFDAETFRARREQLWLEQSGIQTYNCATSQKNTTDLHLTISALSDLYEKPHIDIFVIVTNDRDFVPLIQQIRSKDKMVVLVCSKNGVNSILPNNVDAVLYIDDLFTIETRFVVDEHINENAKRLIYNNRDRENALYVYRFLLRGNIFKGFLSGRNQMSVVGLSTHISRNSSFSKDDVIRLLMICSLEGYFRFVERDGEIVMEDFKMDVVVYN